VELTHSISQSLEKFWTFKRSSSTSLLQLRFLWLAGNVLVEICNSHLPKAPYPLNPALDCQAGDRKPDILLVADHLVKVLACELAAPAPYNSIHCLYEASSAILS
jgi:hypothetical protein